MEKENIEKDSALYLAINFAWYVYKHPELRFWQSLRAWTKIPFIFVADTLDVFEKNGDKYTTLKDTFYWEKKNEL